MWSRACGGSGASRRLSCSTSSAGRRATTCGSEYASARKSTPRERWTCPDMPSSNTNLAPWKGHQRASRFRTSRRTGRRDHRANEPLPDSSEQSPRHGKRGQIAGLGFAWPISLRYKVGESLSSVKYITADLVERRWRLRTYPRSTCCGYVAG